MEDEPYVVADVSHILVQEQIGLAPQKAAAALDLARMVVVGLRRRMGARRLCVVLLLVELALVVHQLVEKKVVAKQRTEDSADRRVGYEGQGHQMCRLQPLVDRLQLASLQTQI